MLEGVANSIQFFPLDCFQGVDASSRGDIVGYCLGDIVGYCVAGNDGAKRLLNVINVINETVGDAISDMLLVEVILREKDWTIADWDQQYTDLPNRMVKVTIFTKHCGLIHCKHLTTTKRILFLSKIMSVNSLRVLFIHGVSIIFITYKTG